MTRSAQTIRLCFIGAVVACWTVPRAAQAQQQTVTGAKALSHFRAPGSGALGKRLKPVRRSLKVRGVVTAGGDGTVLVQQPLTPKLAKALPRMGYKTVKTAAEINDKTILGGHFYILYSINKKGRTYLKPDDLKGKQVELTVAFAEDGTPMVTALRRVK